MLDKLKDKKIWIGFIVAIILIGGIIGTVCIISNMDDTGNSDTKVEEENKDENDEGLTVAGDDESDDMHEDSVKAPSSWGGSSEETDDTNESGESENNVKDESKENDDNIEEDESLKSEDRSYGRIF